MYEKKIEMEFESMATFLAGPLFPCPPPPSLFKKFVDSRLYFDEQIYIFLSRLTNPLKHDFSIIIKSFKNVLEMFFQGRIQERPPGALLSLEIMLSYIKLKNLMWFKSSPPPAQSNF